MGDFLACARIYQVREAEAITQWEALSRIKGKGFHDVFFERDSLVVTTAIQVHGEKTTEFGSIIQQRLAFFSHSDSISLVFVRRQANSLTNRLARDSIPYFSPMFWTELPVGIIQRKPGIAQLNTMYDRYIFITHY